MLTDLVGRVEIDKDGDFTFAHESTRVFVAVRPWNNDTNVVVQFIAVTNCELQGSPELFEHIATQANHYLFGALSLFKREDGMYNANLKHTVLGDTLDPDEFKHGLLCVTATADKIDDEIQKRFGGKRMADL